MLTSEIIAMQLLPNKTLLYILVALFLSATMIPASQAQITTPNVIFILVDDQGYYDLGCYGATEIRTPRIDKMASEGILFSDYYAAAPICSASRAGLLTGCYPRRVGNHIWVHRADSDYGINPEELTIAELFRQSGYHTACIGKWHLGFQEPFLPLNQGFDHYFGLLHNLDPVEVVYFEEQGGVPLIRNGKEIKRPVDPAELTRLYTDEAIEFIEKNKSNPFFLYLPHTMLHVPLGVSKEFQGTSEWGEYGDAIQELDHHVGRIFDSLTRLRLDQNTIVIYASDNGRRPGRNPQQPLRGNKLTTWEGGIRVPAIAWAPGLNLLSNVRLSTPIRAMDWYPTLATLAGIKVPDGPAIDGRDVTPVLLGESEAVPAPDAKLSLNASVPLRRRWDPAGEWASLITRHEYNDAFFYHGSEGTLSAVRWKNWKLFINPNLTLYNLEKDPGESTPVRNGTIIRKLRGMTVLFQEEMRLDTRQAGLQANAPGKDASTTIPPAVEKALLKQEDVTYASYGDRTLEMDIYRPKGQWGTLPAVVCIHGGGWAKGDRTSHAKLAKAIAAKGFVTATISYRLSGEAAFPAQINDCKAAVRFLRANAQQYGLDPDNIGAIGLSAGGHLTALLATSAGTNELEGDGGNQGISSTIQAAVPMGAQTDFLSSRVRGVAEMEERGAIWRQFLGGTQEEARETYRLASPIEHLSESTPPVWFISGENDDPSTHAERFRSKLKSIKIQTGLTIIKGAPHGFLNKQVWFDQAVDKATEFFKKELSNSGP